MNIPSESFWRAVLVVFTGAATAQAIPLVGSLLLARLYAPSEFGVFAVWLGLAALGAVLMTGRYEMAIAIESEGSARLVALLATLVTVGAACLPLAVVVMAVKAFGVGRDIDAALWPAGVVTAALIAASQAWQLWAAAEGRFRELSTVRMCQAAAITGLQIAAGELNASATSLALAHLAGVGVGGIVAALHAPRANASLPQGAALWAAMRGFCVRHRRFPLLALPADGVNAAAGQLPLLIVAARFGADIAGLLALTMRTLGAPIALVGASVLDVFRRRSATSWRASGQCHDDFLQTALALTICAIAFAVPIALFAEPLFALAFGERWRMSGIMALWLLPLFALRLVASPLSYVFYIANKQHVDLLWQIGLLAMTLTTLSVPGEYAMALMAYSIGYGAMYCVYLMLSYRFSRGAVP